MTTTELKVPVREVRQLLWEADLGFEDAALILDTLRTAVADVHTASVAGVADKANAAAAAAAIPELRKALGLLAHSYLGLRSTLLGERA